MFAIGVGVGATQGRALFGRGGAILGAAVGASAAIWCFFKVIVPWRARRIVPSIIDQADGHTLGQAGHADESLRRMLEAYSRHEARSTDETTNRRGPERLP